MERVEVAVLVPLKAAVMNAQETYGPAVVVPTEEQLKALTRDERRRLVRFVEREGCEETQKRLRIRSCPADWDGVLEAIRRMMSNEEHAQKNAEDSMEVMRSREKSTHEVAQLLRRMTGQSNLLSDREVIENSIPAIMEEVRDKLVEAGIVADLIRIVTVESSEWRKIQVNVRTEYTLEAGGIARKVEQAMENLIPAVSGALLRAEVMVTRVRQRSREDGIVRHPITYVIGLLHCAACSSTAIMVRAEPL